MLHKYFAVVYVLTPELPQKHSSVVSVGCQYAGCPCLISWEEVVKLCERSLSLLSDDSDAVVEDILNFAVGERCCFSLC